MDSKMLKQGREDTTSAEDALIEMGAWTGHSVFIMLD